MREVIFSNGCRVDADKVTRVLRCTAGDTMVKCGDPHDTVFVSEDATTVERLIRQAKGQRGHGKKLAPVGYAPADAPTEPIL